LQKTVGAPFSNGLVGMRQVRDEEVENFVNIIFNGKVTNSKEVKNSSHFRRDVPSPGEFSLFQDLSRLELLSEES